MSLIALLVNPFAVPSILGVVFSSIGLARSGQLEGAGHKVTGRGTAIAGIVVGIACMLYFEYRVSQLVS